MIFFLSIKWSLNKTLMVCGIIDGVWGGGMPEIQVPLMHLDFLEKLNHHLHLQNKTFVAERREMEELSVLGRAPPLLDAPLVL